MLKKYAYTIALTYVTTISTQKTSISVARRLRGLLKPYIDFAMSFEKDRKEIQDHKEIDTAEKNVQINILFDEDIDIPLISEELLNLCEEGKIELTAQDINSIFCYE